MRQPGKGKKGRASSITAVLAQPAAAHKRLRLSIPWGNRFSPQYLAIVTRDVNFLAGEVVCFVLLQLDSTDRLNSSKIMIFSLTGPAAAVAAAAAAAAFADFPALSGLLSS